MDAVELGFRHVDVPAEVRAAALANLARWRTEAPFAPYREAVEALIAANRWDELVDAFRQVLPFGTGGRRGAVGVGPNRMNPWTVGTSVAGHARWLQQRGLAGDVVVAYDVRRFTDARGVFPGPTPLHGLSSRDLAELAARVYAANGLVAHLLPWDAAHAMSTPELSFVIRKLGAVGGLNVSASHNPPDDNGVKVYDERGAQLVPPLDEALLEVVAGVAEAHAAGWDEAVARGAIRELHPDLHAAYVALTGSVVPRGPRGDLRVRYTPLHGTGTVHESLRNAGFTVALHEPQATRDGAFPTVPKGVANPENAEAMAHAIAAADGADLVVGTDPDADRIGCEVLHRDASGHGSYVHLTGNDIAALVVHALLEVPRTDHLRPLVVVTEVTSARIGRIARGAGADVVDDLLVGFKYVAEGMHRLESGGWRGLVPTETAFLCGAEESHGALVTDRIRDKDAAGAAVVLCWLADRAKTEGKTLVDVLRALAEAHGPVRNGQVTLAFPGATGSAKMAALLDRLRASPPAAFGPFHVRSATDHRDEAGRFGPFVSESDRAARNVLVYGVGPAEGAEGGRVIFRPSGTEPKLKIYLELSGGPVAGAKGDDGLAAPMATLEAALRALA